MGKVFSRQEVLCSSFTVSLHNVVSYYINHYDLDILVSWLGIRVWYILSVIQNNSAVKKVSGSEEGYCEKRCEIQCGGQEMAMMIG